MIHTFAPISKQSELFGSDAMMFLIFERNRQERRRRQRKVKLLAALGYIHGNVKYDERYWMGIHADTKNLANERVQILQGK